MKFAALLSTLAVLAGSAFATTGSVSYDQTYDVASNSLDIVACSDGPNGLLTKGYTTFGSLPNFPFIGGVPAVATWDSVNCGTCWSLTYDNTTIKVLAIDVSTGYNIALEAMNKLTDNQAEFLGRVNATAAQVAASECGL